MRVVVDTSVWSLALLRRNPKPAAETEALAELFSEGRVVLLGAIRQEIFSGVRDSEQFDRLRAALEPFPDEPVGASDYVDAAKGLSLHGAPSREAAHFLISPSSRSLSHCFIMLW
jgi:predicted nucleic acid-binding protein